MNQQQRITIYIALCYFAMSTALFTIFYFTYSYYFYKNQKQTILGIARNSEEKDIKIALEKFRSSYGKYELIAKEHDRMAMKMAKDKLSGLIAALDAESDPVPLPKAKKVEEVNPSEVFIENNDAPILKKEPFLKPISKSELEKPFVDIFNKIVSSGKDDVDLRRFTKGMEQLVDMSYILVDKQKIKLYKGNEVFDWEIRAYAIPYQQKKDSIVERIELLEQEKEIALKRISIYKKGQEEPLYKGMASKVEYVEAQAIFEKAEKVGKTIFSSAKPFESYQLNNGEEEFQIRLSFFIADPEMGICIASSKPIFKSEWMQFSFLERNWQPILAFIIMAWVVCPILGWIAYKMASQFKFKFTVDLDGDEGEFTGLRNLKHLESTESEQHDQSLPKKPSESSFYTTSYEDGSVEPDEPQPESAPEKIPSVSFEELSKKKQTVTASMANDSLQLETSEINQIRNNNIRKSTGEFNRHQDDEENTDYLAGVQSEVLKSLIKKLRED